MSILLGSPRVKCCPVATGIDLKLSDQELSHPTYLTPPTPAHLENLITPSPTSDTTTGEVRI